MLITVRHKFWQAMFAVLTVCVILICITQPVYSQCTISHSLAGDSTTINIGNDTVVNGEDDLTDNLYISPLHATTCRNCDNQKTYNLQGQKVRTHTRTYNIYVIKGRKVIR